MQMPAKVTALCTLAFILAGCFGSGEKGRLQLSICELLEDNDEWIKPALQARETYGTPLHLTLAMLELPLSNLEKKHIRPRMADWDEYRIRNEQWGASAYEPEYAADFIGWFTQETNKRNKIHWDNTKGHYLALRLGHGAYERFDPAKFPQLEQQAVQVGIRAARWQHELAGCKSIWQSESWLQKIKPW
ncbi:MAG: hypothetical protein CSA60_02970 [Neptuniibacter caesariensis]|uniref:Transglycosylase SLT domain-containing protein n=1 Tax=Neptuniibacter caesariensis TaxID=207954 RepID=A0A2G6JM69_NEPCE|nr:MAG: hypothetical protein CSA60_02970 [Neptuniibacter caesariensis]